MSQTLATLPRRFGRYALFDFVGKGGMAEIFLARAETELGASRLCVVKEILPELADVAAFADMLVFEAKLAARLNHAHIVQVFDLGRTEGRLYIAMEYVEGYDLNALLRIVSKKKIPFLLEHALHVVSCILRGLSFAHRAKAEDGSPLGIVHRDVSPSNVLISLDGEVKLCDFGIAKANARLGAQAGDVGEALRGKAGYMSPEHARGEPIDARADVFAAGIVLWELLSGRRMYRATDGENLLDVARRAEIPVLAPRGEVPELPRLQALVARALAQKPDDRFESAAAMSRELDGYLTSAGIVTNPLRFGRWLREQVGTEEIDERRERERLLTPHGEVKVAFSSLDEPTAAAVANLVPADQPTSDSVAIEEAPEHAAEAPAEVAEAPTEEVLAAELEEAPPSSRQVLRIERSTNPSTIPVPSLGAMRTFVRDLERTEASSLDATTPVPQAAPLSVPPPKGWPLPVVLVTMVLIVALICALVMLATR